MWNRKYSDNRELWKLLKSLMQISMVTKVLGRSIFFCLLWLYWLWVSMGEWLHFIHTHTHRRTRLHFLLAVCENCCFNNVQFTFYISEPYNNGRNIKYPLKHTIVLNTYTSMVLESTRYAYINIYDWKFSFLRNPNDSILLWNMKILKSECIILYVFTSIGKVFNSSPTAFNSLLLESWDFSLIEPQLFCGSVIFCNHKEICLLCSLGWMFIFTDSINIMWIASISSHHHTISLYSAQYIRWMWR